MKVLNNDEMLEYNGGIKLYTGYVAVIAGVVSFILGFIDGYTNPQKCR